MSVEAMEDAKPGYSAAAAVQGEVFGHPRGLIYLTTAEGWERFSYFGMQSLLVLYLTHHLLQPDRIGVVVGLGYLRTAIEGVTGQLSSAALASQIFGLYTGLVYLTPILGGLLADRWLDRTVTITIGAVTMAAGHFLMAFEASFLFAIVLLLVGVGCFKGNIASQVGQLYDRDDPRRVTAFQVFQFSISASVMLAPLVCGTLGEKAGWHYGFSAAGVGMLIALVGYRRGRRWLPLSAPSGGTIAEERVPWTRADWRAVLFLVALLPIIAGTMVGNQQMFNAFVIWGEANFDLRFAGFDIPVTWILSLDAAVSAMCLLLVMGFWRAYARRRTEPVDLVKMAVGGFVMAAAPIVLVIASLVQQASGGGKISLGWALGFELVNEIGFAALVPVALSFFTRVAPKKIQGVAIGFYYLSFFFCNLAVGRLGGMLEGMSALSFWSMHAAIVGGAAVLLTLAALWSRRVLDVTER
jgi:POT family proton-dependent oligopeptide transporter